MIIPFFQACGTADLPAEITDDDNTTYITLSNARSHGIAVSNVTVNFSGNCVINGSVKVKVTMRSALQCVNMKHLVVRLIHSFLLICNWRYLEINFYMF